MKQGLDGYLRSLLPNAKEWITEMELTAQKNHIPIMDPVSMQFVTQLIQMQKPKTILEIGTAIGYSALRMAEAFHHAKVTTIERDINRYYQAKENVKRLNKENQIELIYGDAMEVLPSLPPESFEMIFIDAAKGKYKHFFELSHPLLKYNGIILSDNVLFRGYVTDPENIKQPRHRKMVNKLQEYNRFISGHSEYSTSIIPIGDGVAISMKVEGRS
ncbi:O-methyltransferase [Virgibacillus kimchii]